MHPIELSHINLYFVQKFIVISLLKKITTKWFDHIGKNFCAIR